MILKMPEAATEQREPGKFIQNMGILLEYFCRSYEMLRFKFKLIFIHWEDP